jgi:hypothetical protein
MSKSEAAPPDTLAGGAYADSRPAVVCHLGETVNMDEYRRTVPWWKRAYKHSLTQMMLLSVQAFCGPAMWDAIAGRYPLSRLVRQLLSGIRSRWRWSCYP